MLSYNKNIIVKDDSEKITITAESPNIEKNQNSQKKNLSPYFKKPVTINVLLKPNTLHIKSVKRNVSYLKAINRESPNLAEQKKPLNFNQKISESHKTRSPFSPRCIFKKSLNIFKHTPGNLR